MDELENVDTIPQNEEVTEVIESESVDNQSTEEETTVVEPFLSVKYNKEEMALDREKAIEYAQKGLNYDKVHEQYENLKNDPRLSFVENQAKKHEMSVEQYLQAVEQEEVQRRIDAIAEKEQMSPELARKKYDIEQRELRQQQKEEAERKKEEDQKQYLEFLDEYPEIKYDTIPQEVWDMVNAGKHLVDAYARHELQQLKKGIKIAEQNKKNAKVSTGSTKSDGATSKGDYINLETFEANKSNMSWLTKNFDKITKSRAKW